MAQLDRVSRFALTCKTALDDRRAGRGLERCRVQLICGLVLVSASGCTQALDLDGYTFRPTDVEGQGGFGGTILQSSAGSNGESGSSGSSAGGAAGAGTNDPDAGSLLDDAGSPDSGGGNPDANVGETGGTGGVAGASGASGAAGTGTSGAGGTFSGTGGVAGTAGASGSAGTAGTAGTSSCLVTERCVPPIPVGWTGPIAVSEGGAAFCPIEYASPLGDVNAGFQAGGASCSCGCIVDAVDCRLLSGISGEFITTAGSCSDIPEEDDCLYAVADASCEPQPLETIGTVSWQTTERTCGGAISTGICSGGSCYPGVSSFGSVCIQAPGDIACPTGFPDRTAYFRGFSDTRDCTTCSCSPIDQVCQIEGEVCDLGFSPFTLTNNGACQQLNSSDGDDVTVFSTAVADTGSCETSGGTLSGAATPTNPVTVCCLD